MTLIPAIYIDWFFLIAFGILSVAYLQARHRISTLCVRLEAAGLQCESDRFELTERSKLDSIKDEFVSNLSHELRTPLTSIRAALGLLDSGVLGTFDTQARQLIHIALTNTERLIRLINEVLDLQRMDSGLSSLQVRRCSLLRLVHEAIETMTAMAGSAGVELTVSPAAQALLPSIYFDGDCDRILQVLTNLLSNAIKFSPPRSVVTIEVETPPDALILRVADQGRGIPEDQLESIFERFRQVEHADARQRGGTGLGLAICRGIIQQHDGTIWAQRNPGKGASVCIKLPRSQRASDVVESESGAFAEAVTPGLSPGHSAGLIDDEDQAHRTLAAQQLSGDDPGDLARHRPVPGPRHADPASRLAHIMPTVIVRS